MFNSITNMDITPLVSLSAYRRSSYFNRIFRWLDLGGEPCPVGPNPQNNKPKVKQEVREHV